MTITKPTYDVDWLRSRFAGARARVAPTFYADDEPLPDTQAQRLASVLIPVIAREEPTVLFTVRSSRLRSGAGQISFPGGGVEADDASPEHTALRETFEEIGLHARHVEVIGQLSAYVTRAGYRVTPVVGVVQPPFELQPNADEVAEIFEVPLWYLLNKNNHLLHTTQLDGRLRHYYAVQYERYYIRGVTAGLLVNLHRHVTAP